MNKVNDKQDIISEIMIMAKIVDKIKKACGFAFAKNSKIRMDLQSYLIRIYQYSECHKNCFIMALILIDRVMEQYVKSQIALPFNPHTLSLTCLVVCIKMTEDDPSGNTYYARLGGVSNEEMLKLELYLLNLLNFRIFISEDEFQSYKSGLADLNISN